MNYKHLFIGIIVTIASLIDCLAQTNESINFWEKIIDEKTLSEIAEITETNTNYPWPKILSSYAIDKLPKEQQELNKQHLELAKAFRAKLETSFQRDLQPDKTELEKEVKTYTTLAKQFRESGGYGNLLLADSLYQLVIFRLSDWLVRHPDKASEVEEMTKGWNVTPVELKKLLTEMSDQDNYLETHPDLLNQIDETKSLSENFDRQIVNEVWFLPVEKNWTSSLLENSSVIRLLYRMAETESLMKANLMGFIEFLKQGGTFEEINISDVRPFNQRMAAFKKVYVYPLMQKRFLSVEEPFFLLELHRNSQSKEVRLNQPLK